MEKGLIVNGLPGISEAYTIYIFSSDTDLPTYQAISGLVTNGRYQAVGAIIPESESNVFTLAGWNGILSTGIWNGSGNFQVVMFNPHGNAGNRANPKYQRTMALFTNGTAAMRFSDFIAVVTSFTVIINSLNGTESSIITGVNYGEKIEKPLDPIRDGFGFSGWYTYFGDWNFDTDVVMDNITIYANWLQQYTVTFISNGGSNVNPITRVNHGSTIIKPKDPINAGYGTFDNWYTNEQRTNVFTFDNPVITNIILYANWNATYRLGDTGPGGGRIFYRAETGFIMTDTGETYHYLEAAPNDINSTFTWASSLYTNTYINTELDIGTGRNNTDIILTIDINAPAARACKNYSNNDKTDWFLPSFRELGRFNDHPTISIGNLGTIDYWSSSQAYYNDEVNYIGFNSNGTFAHSGNGKKTSAYLVRPIRAF
jgi:hypothetical protein